MFFANIRFYLLLLFYLLFLQCNSTVSPINESVLAYDWIANPIDFYQNTSIDSTTYPHSLLLETFSKKKGIISSLIPINKIYKTDSNFEIKIKYKTESCKELSLIITTIGQCEEVNSIDTIKLPTTKEWNNSVRAIIIKNVCLLNISIESLGLDKSNAKIWISELELTMDGKGGIKKIMLKDKTEKKIKEDYLIRWEDKRFDTLPFFKKKILAIGETTHGTKTMNDIAIEISKERILKNQCKVILLEIPLEYSFYINRYVKNDMNFRLENISSYFDNFLFSDSILSFIQWLRDYNLTREQKIYFLGFDINSVQLKSRIDLFNYILNLNLDKHNTVLDAICNALLDTKISFERIIHMFDNNQLASIFDENELELLLHCMRVTNKHSNSYYRFFYRDKTMSENATFIVDNFLKNNETITIFGHFGHLNYLNRQDLSIVNNFSLGYYMRNKYKDDYSFIALTTNEGTAMLSKSASEFEIINLKSAPQKSLEYQINKLNMDSVYLSMDNLNCSDVLKLRNIGNRNLSEQFRFIIPKSRMEGVLFVKKTISINKITDVLEKKTNSDLILMNSYKEALDKINKK